MIRHVLTERRHECLDDLGIDDRATARDLANRSDELLRVRNALLQEVGATRRTFLEQCSRVCGRVELAEQHYAYLGVTLMQAGSDLQALVGVRWRHANIRQDHIRLLSLDGLEQRVEITALASTSMLASLRVSSNRRTPSRTRRLSSARTLGSPQLCRAYALTPARRR